MKPIPEPQPHHPVEAESPERLTERQREKLRELDEEGASTMRAFIPQLERGLDTLPIGQAAEQVNFFSQILARACNTETQRQRIRRDTLITDDDELDLAFIEKHAGLRVAYVKESTPGLSAAERRPAQNGSARDGRTLAETRITEHRLYRGHQETILKLIDVFEEASERQHMDVA